MCLLVVDHVLPDLGEQNERDYFVGAGFSHATIQNRSGSRDAGRWGLRKLQVEQVARSRKHLLNRDAGEACFRLCMASVIGDA